MTGVIGNTNPRRIVGKSANVKTAVTPTLEMESLMIGVIGNAFRQVVAGKQGPVGDANMERMVGIFITGANGSIRTYVNLVAVADVVK